MGCQSSSSQEVVTKHVAVVPSSDGSNSDGHTNDTLPSALRQSGTKRSKSGSKRHAQLAVSNDEDDEKSSDVHYTLQKEEDLHEQQHLVDRVKFAERKKLRVARVNSWIANASPIPDTHQDDQDSSISDSTNPLMPRSTGASFETDSTAAVEVYDA